VASKKKRAKNRDPFEKIGISENLLD